MRSIEKSLAVVGTTLLCALGTAACGSSSPEHSPKNKAPKVSPGPIRVEATYYPNGTRLLEMINSGVDIYRDGEYYYPEPIFEFCDGRDLVEETLEQGAGTTSVSRSINHPACTDGKLTPSDFALHAYSVK